MPAREKERRMETVHLIGQFNKPPKRNRADQRAPPPPGAQTHRYQRRHGRRRGAAALRPSPLWHVDGTSAALPACWAGEGQLKSL